MNNPEKCRNLGICIPKFIDEQCKTLEYNENKNTLNQNGFFFGLKCWFGATHTCLAAAKFPNNLEQSNINFEIWSIFRLCWANRLLFPSTLFCSLLSLLRVYQLDVAQSFVKVFVCDMWQMVCIVNIMSAIHSSSFWLIYLMEWNKKLRPNMQALAFNHSIKFPTKNFNGHNKWLGETYIIESVDFMCRATQKIPLSYL